MPNTLLKLRLVYLPFLLASIATIVGYTALRWLLDIELSVIHLKADLLNFWIPIALPWLPVLIWLRKPIRILNVNKSNNGYFVYQLVAVLFMFIPTLLAQEYITKASYDLVEVSSVTDLADHAGERYFQLDQFEVKHHTALPYVTSRVSGKYNQTLTFYIYIATPMLAAEPNYWYAVRYKKSLSNNISDERKEAAYQTFLNDKEEEFKAYDFDEPVTYFENLPYSDDRDGFTNAIQQGHPNLVSDELFILEPSRAPFEARLGNTLNWTFGSFAIGASVFLLMVLIPRINEWELDIYQKKEPVTDGLSEMWVYFNPLGKYKMTALLMLANIGVFLVLVGLGVNIMSATPQELLTYGGNRTEEFEQGEYWRLISSMFMHGGFLHIVMNLYGIGATGSNLERMLKPVGLLLCYLLCGIGAGLASVYFNDNMVSVGASGAIFGLMGIILIFNVSRIFPKSFSGIIWISLVLYGGISLLVGFLGSNVDNAGHLGGLASGAVIGLLLVIFFRTELRRNARGMG